MRWLLLILTLFSAGLLAQSTGPYAPAAGQANSRAIHKDSSLIRAWADSISVQRGYLDIAQKTLGFASFGDSLNPLGPANGQVISLGDSGLATYILKTPIWDQAGAEFAIFENSFSDVFLEFAFVEVSQDGINFHRFPAISLIDTVVQTGAFGSSEASQVHNLAGKYRLDFGVPFDLADIPQIDSIYYIRIVDAIGTIDPKLAGRDSRGAIINEPYPTAFASGGFDLDALAFLSPNSLNLKEQDYSLEKAYPNPARLSVGVPSAIKLELFSLNGHLLKTARWEKLNLDDTPAGIYLLQANFEDGHSSFQKIQVLP